MIKQRTTTITQVFSATTAGLLFFSQHVSAANVSIDMTPILNEAGASLNGSNDITASQISSTLVKITGTNTYVADESGSATITIFFTGSISAAAGETINLDYDFSLNLTGSGTVAWELSSEIPLGPGVSIPGPSDSGSIVGAQSTMFSNSESVTAPFEVDNLFDLILTATWTGTTAGDELQIIIPNNSIDISVVPEPSSALMLCLGSLFLMRRKR